MLCSDLSGHWRSRPTSQLTHINQISSILLNIGFIILTMMDQSVAVLPSQTTRGRHLYHWVVLDAHHSVRMYKTIVTGALNTKRSTCKPQLPLKAVMKLLKIEDQKRWSRASTIFFPGVLQTASVPDTGGEGGFLVVCWGISANHVRKESMGSKEEVQVYNFWCNIKWNGHCHSHRYWQGICPTTLWSVHRQMDKEISWRQEGEPRTPRMVRKYTKSEEAFSEHGGWSDKGIEMLNMLGGIVEDDRKGTQ